MSEAIDHVTFVTHLETDGIGERQWVVTVYHDGQPLGSFHQTDLMDQIALDGHAKAMTEACQRLMRLLNNVGVEIAPKEIAMPIAMIAVLGTAL